MQQKHLNPLTHSNNKHISISLPKSEEKKSQIHLSSHEAITCCQGPNQLPLQRHIYLLKHLHKIIIFKCKHIYIRQLPPTDCTKKCNVNPLQEIP